jgi:hypothetical protein
MIKYSCSKILRVDGRPHINHAYPIHTIGAPACVYYKRERALK